MEIKSYGAKGCERLPTTRSIKLGYELNYKNDIFEQIGRRPSKHMYGQ
jgi:hypothetical protein